MKSFVDSVTQKGKFDVDEVIELLVTGNPSSIHQYSEHIHKVLNIIYEDGDRLCQDNLTKLTKKAEKLFTEVTRFIDDVNPLESKLYVIVEKNFDMLIRIGVAKNGATFGKVEDKHWISFRLSCESIKFLTTVIMGLNYWELYNLLSWKPAIYHFLSVIQFDLSLCYEKFLNDYSKYNYKQRLDQAKISRGQLNWSNKDRIAAKRAYQEAKQGIRDQDDDNNNNNSVSTSSESGSTTPRTSSANTSIPQREGDPFINSDLHSLAPRDDMDIDDDDDDDEPSTPTSGRKRSNSGKSAEDKFSQKVIKKSSSRLSNKSSNYDPDVVHECQLPIPDTDGKLCNRRFSRKYELIRHQETVHSKKKKLFKCFVCVKQNPNTGPRIFTRHDTLAKHIRVNHKISGKEAKQEVAYSKRNAEVVEEGDITVHVGRRKTKVDFELRAHMERKRGGDIIAFGDYDDHDTNGVIVDDEVIDEDMEEGESQIADGDSQMDDTKEQVDSISEAPEPISQALEPIAQTLEPVQEPIHPPQAPIQEPPVQIPEQYPQLQSTEAEYPQQFPPQPFPPQLQPPTFAPLKDRPMMYPISQYQYQAPPQMHQQPPPNQHQHQGQDIRLPPLINNFKYNSN